MKRLREFKLRRLVGEGEQVPTGYGIAYRHHLMSYRAVAYPVPLNLAVRAGRWIWYRLKVPRWGTAFADVTGRSKGLRVEASGQHDIKVWLYGRQVQDQLRAMDLHFTAGEPVRATLHVIETRSQFERGMQLAIDDEEVKVSYGYGN